jgi:sugar/nucleoside kinase (ribokinase family)
VTVDRIVLLGSVIVDVVLVVPGLPRRGGDVLADDGGLATGGGHNVLSAAARQGLPGALAGRHGTGPFGDLARRDLAAAGVELLLPRTRTATPASASGSSSRTASAPTRRTPASRAG